MYAGEMNYQLINAIRNKMLICLVALTVLAHTTVGLTLAQADAEPREWLVVGEPAFTPGTVNDLFVKVHNGVVYAAFRGSATTDKVTVMRLAGDQWTEAGEQGFATDQARSSSFSLDESGVPYIVYTDAAAGDKASVMRLVGEQWEYVGLQGFSAGFATSPAIHVDNGVPYVAYRDNNASGKLTVMKLHNGNWTSVGTPGISPNAIVTPTIYVDNGVPYAAYQDVGDPSNRKLAVVRYDALTAQWTHLGSFPSNNSQQPRLYVDDGAPYFAYQDNANEGKVSVVTFNGSQWEPIGQAGFSQGTVSSLSFHGDDSGLYVAYQDGGNSNKATVMKYENEQEGWVTVGYAGISGSTASRVSVFVDGGTPYVAYTDAASPSLGKATVKKFSEPPAAPQSADAANNAFNVSEEQVEALQAVTLTATGDRQNEAGAASGDERFVPLSWTSTEPDQFGWFTEADGVYTSQYTPEVSGLYTITALFQKQVWNGSVWENALEPTDSKTAEITVLPVVVPDAPVLQPPQTDDRQAALLWSTVHTATAYKIYQSADVSDLGEEIATVTGTVYTVTGLTNGQTYYFSVTAVKPGAESEPSSPVAVTPATVPDAPTNVTAVAGDKRAVVYFTAPVSDGGSPITGYTVISSPEGKTATGMTGPVTVKGLTNGVSYTFTVVAANSVDVSVASAASNAVKPKAPPQDDYTSSPEPETENGQDNEQGTAGADAEAAAQVLVNGRAESAGTATVTQRNGRSVTTIAVDPHKLEERLAAEGSGAVVTIPVSTGSSIVIGELTGQMVRSMESIEAIVEIRTEQAAYTLPAGQINIQTISNQLGRSVALEDIKVRIEVAEPTADTARFVEGAAQRGGITLVAPPVEFSVTAVHGDKTIAVSKFHAYVERTIAVPAGVDPDKITTGVTVDADGTVRHVPTKVVVIDGKYYATISSLTNSLYSVVWNPLAFSDVAGHWAEAAIHDMGARMIVQGFDDGTFHPNERVSRGEFIDIIVRALGLKSERGTALFADVPSTDSYADALYAASEYGLAAGFADGAFRPNESITREQAIGILARAMAWTGLRDSLPEQEAAEQLRVFTDADEASGWARDAIADSAAAGIVVGDERQRLTPQALITRAEAAMLAQRLLQRSDLIND